MRCARALMLWCTAALLAWLLAGDAGAQGTLPKVKLISPTEGMIVPAGDIKVVMSVTGATLLPADNTHDPKTGHFHLYLDKVPEQTHPPGRRRHLALAGNDLYGQAGFSRRPHARPRLGVRGPRPFFAMGFGHGDV